MSDKRDPNAIFNSRILHEEFNEERKRDGLFSMPPSNGISRIARKDKSWSSIPDFFLKLMKRK